MDCQSDITAIKYSAEAHIYSLAQKLVCPHILLNAVVNTILFLSNGIKRFLYEVVVAAFCFLSTDKNSETLHDFGVMV